MAFDAHDANRKDFFLMTVKVSLSFEGYIKEVSLVVTSPLLDLPMTW